MKRDELLKEIDAILQVLPSEQVITVALRYAGPQELKEKIAGVRDKLEALKTKLNGG
jgi:hypothetical protein